MACIKNLHNVVNAPRHADDKALVINNKEHGNARRAYTKNSTPYIAPNISVGNFDECEHAAAV
jgi:hypothetical protein